MSIKKEALVFRARALGAIREYFDGQGFLEVETPMRVPCPAVEPWIEAFPAGRSLFLRTSPELFLKRLLCAGYDRIYELGRVFRHEESGRVHLSEFTMLEWYRVGAGLDELMEDCEVLVERLCGLAGRPAPPRPFPRLTYDAEFRAQTGIDPFDIRNDEDMARLRDAALRFGYRSSEDDTREALVQALFATAVEPSLKGRGAVFLTDFPPWNAALATVRRRESRDVACRFELYLDGIETANAYEELTDAEANLDRIGFCNRERTSAGRHPYPDDDAFAEALRAGLPHSSGIALGIERLLAWLGGRTDLRDVCLFD